MGGTEEFSIVKNKNKKKRIFFSSFAKISNAVFQSRSLVQEQGVSVSSEVLSPGHEILFAKFLTAQSSLFSTHSFLLNVSFLWFVCCSVFQVTALGQCHTPASVKSNKI